MYKNLEAELARANMTKKKLAEEMKRTPTTMSLKLSGRANLTLKECMEIKEILQTTIPLEELFATS